MNLDDELQPIEEKEDATLSPARRRRARRSLILTDDKERAEQLKNLSSKTFPSFETFFFSIIAGLILGAGYILDSQTILILGVLVVPILSPWVGFILATVTGSLRYFLQTLIGLAISFGLVFGSGFLAGKISLIYPPISRFQATMHTHLWWADIGLVFLGAILMVTAVVRSEKQPIIPSVMLAYALYLPLSISGFGYGSDVQSYWLNGLLVFCAYLSLATITGLIALAFVKYRARRASGWLMSLIVAIIAVATFAWISGAYVYFQKYVTIPWNIPTPPIQVDPFTLAQISNKTPEITETHAIASLTATQKIEGTSTPIPTASLTPTITNTPEATAIYAMVITLNNEGANLRDAPEGTIIATLTDGTLLEVLPDNQLINGTNWIHVRTENGLEGWIIEAIIALTTPTPGS